MVVDVSSPRPWGCFSAKHSSSSDFDALPHARGGVSTTPSTTSGTELLFPTPVGVFPIRRITRQSLRPLPHARGGVSHFIREFVRYSLSSPRPWGCFPFKLANKFGFVLFPTPVGVFPIRRDTTKRLLSLPHARGGVSLPTTFQPGEIFSSPHPWGCFRRVLLSCDG